MLTQLLKKEKAKNDAKQRELMALQKDMEVLKKKLKDVEGENERQKQLLKRKTEEVIKVKSVQNHNHVAILI